MDRRFHVATAALLAAALSVLWAGAQEAPQEAAPPPDPLAAMGHEVTSGAVPGYVSSDVCGLCHQDLFLSYQEVGMARSFYRPATAAAQGRVIEDFAAQPYFHEPSRRYYRIEPGEDGALLFRRWQLDAEGRPIHELEIPVDWILGSGNHSRVYLYRSEMGELRQLPLAWYSQEGGHWAMAPGYDRPDHEGVTRRVRRECMFCHNGYPDVPAGSDAWEAPHTYPEELPEGTGCQRCHGPGAEHVRRALSRGRSKDSTPEAVRAAIVNPGRLDPALRNSVCYECHMQPSVAIPGVRRFGRGDYSFRPGELLDDYRVQLDPVEEGREPGGRFEINHHPHRLEQSPCFQASGGALSCLTCHDPHRKVPAEERAAHYRAACLGCHEDLDHPELSGPVAVAASDCTTCHMPLRRTEDVVHVLMTDHRITRKPPPAEELLAPREEKDPVIVGLELLRPERAPKGAEGEVYRAVAALRAGQGASALEHLKANLPRSGIADTEPWLELGQKQLSLGQLGDAEATFRSVLVLDPGSLLAREWLAVALHGTDREEEAIALLRGVLEEEPDRPEPRYNLALFLLAKGGAEADAEAIEEAADHLRRVTGLRPVHADAWEHLGAAHLALRRPAEAADALRQALAVDPAHTRSYLRLADALLALDRRDEAERYLRVGAREAREPEAVRAKLEGVLPETH
jgi:tetratricopeptide (TPR) repeat protein